ncbi:hypothetical protein COL940_001883 [Colletotrichum noveboracense]|nr:hypothetical protein COL940_001883 [Colletotrichum noveboracense]
MASDTKYDSRLEEGLLPIDEKRDSTISRPSKEPTKKMAGPRRVLLGVVVCGLMTLSLASVIGHRGMPCARDHHAKAQVVISEEDLNNPAKADLLHKLLHAYFPDRYQDGVYASDKEALEAVQADDADLASALLQLAKRQDNTTTSAATEASQTPSASVAATTSESVANTPTSAPATDDYVSGAGRPDDHDHDPAAAGNHYPSNHHHSGSGDNYYDTGNFSSSPYYWVYECVRVGYVYLLSSRDYYGRDILVPHNLECAFFILCVRICNVLSTFTSTASNGDVVLVTATSVVAVAPDAEPTSTSGSGSGGLQNGGVPIGSVSFGVPVALAGFVAGAMLLL